MNSTPGASSAQSGYGRHVRSLDAGPRIKRFIVDSDTDEALCWTTLFPEGKVVLPLDRLRLEPADRPTPAAALGSPAHVPSVYYGNIHDDRLRADRRI
jgi:hypothetical protein